MNNRTTDLPSPILFRDAASQDIDAMKELIVTEGANRWNHLPREAVRRHLEMVATGETRGVLAIVGESLIGLATFLIGDLSLFNLGAGFVPAHPGDREPGVLLGYVAEVVVHSGYAGRGIGSRLMEEAKKRSRALGAVAVYAKRHEENAGSAGMMRKAGFLEVSVFSDPEARTAGSRRTSVSRCEL